MTSYNIDYIYWPHVIHMVIRVGCTSNEHRLWVVVYKVDYFVPGTLSSSLVFTPIQEFVLLPHSKGLSS